jgi:hypothetical protein
LDRSVMMSTAIWRPQTSRFIPELSDVQHQMWC